MNAGLPSSVLRDGKISIAFDGDTVYIGTSNGVYRSTDGASTWTVANGGMPASGRLVSGYPALLTFNGTLFAGAYGSMEFVAPRASLGVYRSRTSGQSWEAVNAGLSFNYLHLFPNAMHGSTVYAGSSTTSIFDARSVLYRSTDNGATWSGVEGDEIESRSLIASGDSLIAGTITFSSDKSGIAVSRDEGSTWTMITDSASRVAFSTAFETKAGINVLAVRENGMIAATMTGDLYWSSDAGISWTPSQGVTGLGSMSLVFDRGTALAGTMHGVYRSSDGGDTWRPDTLGMGNLNVTSLSVAPGRIVAGIGATPSGTPGHGVYMRHPDSSAWSTSPTEWWWIPDRTDVRDLTACSHGILAGTGNEGWALWKDYGAWIKIFDEGITSVAANDTFLFVVTANGVFRASSDAIRSGIGEHSRALPTSVTMHALYPNPAQTSTTVEYFLPAATQTQLDVCDALGRRVATILDAPRTPGWHRAEISTRGLANGFYWCALRTQGSCVTRATMVYR
jgi:photosystem II stability/assembly factor-like uncharacterized protein